MAAEDWIDEAWYPGDEYDGVVNCNRCDGIGVWEQLRGKWVIVDYYTGELHKCAAPTDEFPKDEADAVLF